MILKAKNLHKSYGKLSVLSGVDLNVKEGESIAICGRSGEGKTTLLHILGSLEEPDSGEIEIAALRLTRSNAKEIRNAQIGFIFQSYNLLDDFSVLENVLMPAKIARKNATRERGLELLEIVGLTSKADLRASLLSGGEKQRVAIARALCNDPPLILADEPTGNLDRETGKKIGKILLNLNKALLLVTHDPELAALCHTQYTLQNGYLKNKPRELGG